MLFRNFSRLAALFVIFMLVAPSVWANLMIAPHRVIFEPKQRSVSINLLNTSTTTNTYRLHWV
ncbi:MAG: hypothetical protein OEX07_12070, partial [Gammaproteobacteria bacterium]|nr:hypothetical protein [Gammaproteobacteria bacterium]